MPAKTEKQAAFFRFLAHSPEARAEHGISEKVAREFMYTKRKKKRNALTDSEESDGRDSN